ncbi:hypothetical protein CDL15_Pgr011466 [Punica granatum]|uniref:Tesmin/TSO1-like CXC domain-containing protein n=1 Tax=Punica granatum TaxID=22663 RepID=A0A218WES3_PUNGR|nr:hypothetical protein CDL15_Pgr011466 [Punica granatum]
MGKATRRAKQAIAPENASPSASASPVSSSSTTMTAVSSAAEQSEHYEKRIHDLELENKAYQKEIEGLKNKLGNVSVTPDSVKRLKDGYLQKLNALEEQVKELKKKQDVQSQLSTCRRRNDEGKHLHDEIQKLKAQKVQLQCQGKLDSVQFRLCKAALEKEILQLKKEGRRTEFEMQNLLALNQRQKMRKNEENSMASNRLRNLLESRKVLFSQKTGTKRASPAGIQGLEHEFEVTAHINQLCAEYEHQIEMMADEISKAKEEAELLKQENFRLLIQNKELDCKEDPELRDLKEDVIKLSNLLSQLEARKAKLTFQEDAQGDLTQPSISAGSTTAYSDPNASELENSEEISVQGKKGSGTCCSCSKRSLCKTMKCECRTAGGSCGIACGCSSAKCTNRADLPVKLEESAGTGISDENLNSNSNLSVNAEAEKNVLNSQDAIPHSGPLLAPAETDDHCGLKKMPLYDIANTLVRFTNYNS